MSCGGGGQGGGVRAGGQGVSAEGAYGVDRVCAGKQGWLIFRKFPPPIEVKVPLASRASRTVLRAWAQSAPWGNCMCRVRDVAE